MTLRLICFGCCVHVHKEFENSFVSLSPFLGDRGFIFCYVESFEFKIDLNGSAKVRVSFWFRRFLFLFRASFLALLKIEMLTRDFE